MTDFFVTGCSGFLGSEFVRQLLAGGRAVLGGDIVTSDVHDDGFKFIEFDLRDSVDGLTAVDLPKKVIHCAGISDLYEAQLNLGLTLEINFESTSRLASRFLDVHGDDSEAVFVFASSVYAAPNAINYYGLAKYFAEQYLAMRFREVSAKCMIMKFGSVYGMGGGINNGIRKMLASALTKKQVIYNGFRDAERDYIHVSDAVGLTLQEIDICRRSESGAAIYLLSGGVSLKIEEVAEMISRICECDVSPKFTEESNLLNYRSGIPSHGNPDIIPLIPGKFSSLEKNLTEMVNLIRELEN